MSDLRSKFKGASLSSLKETRKEAEKVSKSSYTGSDRPSFHKIEDGVNVFRIAPPHEPDQPSIQPKRSTFLRCEVPELDDDGNETGKTSIKTKPIFVATQHGGLKKDPIELYIDKVYKKVYEEEQDKDERSKRLAPVTGYRDKKGKWNPGIKPSTNYVAYAWKDGALGRVEFYHVMVKKMEELNVQEAAEEEIEVDCFSDPDDGVSLIIEVEKNDKGKKEYKVSKKEYDFAKYLTKYKDKQVAMEKWEEDRSTERLTDAQLEEFAGKESLKELYMDVYTQRDFKLAVSGLSIFDEENGYGIFEDEEFLAELEEIEALVPEKKEKSEDNPLIESGKKSLTKEKPKAKKDEKEEEEKEEESSENDASGFSKIKCKKLLESYILDNYGDDEVLPEEVADDLGTLREWASLALQGEELPFDDFRVEGSAGEVEETEEEEEEPKNNINPELKAKIERLRNRNK